MEQIVSEFFSQYAYQPWAVYSAVVLFMLASGVGLPLPEEVVLISSGLIASRSLHPDLYPPPYPGAPSVNPYVLAVVGMVAVMGSDYLIFWLGRRAGPSVLRMKFFARFVTPAVDKRIRGWVKSYSYWAVLIFRFTPGIRFPGHLMCGAMGLSRARFIAVDFLAAGISVPTQILLLAFYGEEILEKLRRYKLMALGALAVFLVLYFGRKLIARWREPRKT